MKGLAAFMSKLGAEKAAPEAEEAEEDETGGSEMEFARIAADAFASGDKEAGAEALVKTIKACMSGYGPKE